MRLLIINEQPHKNPDPRKSIKLCNLAITPRNFYQNDSFLVAPFVPGLSLVFWRDLYNTMINLAWMTFQIVKILNLKWNILKYKYYYLHCNFLCKQNLSCNLLWLEGREGQAELLMTALGRWWQANDRLMTTRMDKIQTSGIVWYFYTSYF